MEETSRENGFIEDLWRKHHEAILQFLINRAPKDIAEEIAQTTFIKLVEKVRTKNGEPILDYQAWLFRVARNLLIDFYRKRGSRPLVEDIDVLPWIEDSSPQAVYVVSEREMRERVRYIINHNLTEEQRQVIMLRFNEGLPLLEVARRLGKTEEAVKALQYRAVGSIRRLLADDLKK